MTIDTVDEIAAAVAARLPLNGIRLVGIDGPGGSGKSHLARGLSAALKAPIIELDDTASPAPAAEPSAG